MSRAPIKPSSSSSSDTPSSASFLISGLPGQPPSTKKTIIQYAGHLPSHPPSSLNPPPDSHLWFWLVRSKHIAAREKFVIWFNGGPGCSSAEGALKEIGPLTTRKSSEPGGRIELVESAIGWNEYANVLFIDQPAGTGFSFVNVGDDVRELAQAADQIVVFLKNFYQVFPEFSKIDTYLAGESFSGQFIPYFAQAIMDTTTLSTPLLGLLMGNPWINPQIQYLSYLDFAYERGLIVKGAAASADAERSFRKCETVLKDPAQSKRILVEPCEEALQAILDAGAKIVNGTKLTPVAYNITELSNQTLTEWPTGIADLKSYLDQNSTVEALHATGKTSQWALCNDTVGRDMWVPKSAPSSTMIPGLLKKLKIFIYVGDQDYICNSLGLNRTISDMEWNSQRGWGVDDEGQPIVPKDYYVNGTRQGTWTEARGLSYVKYDQASHLVPVDAPYAAHDMLLRLIEVDPLLAAGPARSVASQIGDKDTKGIIMKTLPNGTLMDQDKLKPETVQAPIIGAAPILETVEERQAYYGPRQTIALLVVLTGLILGLVMLFKWRRQRKRGRYAARGKGYHTGGAIRMDIKSPTRFSADPSSIRDRNPSYSKRKKPRRSRIVDQDDLTVVGDEAQTLLSAEEGLSKNKNGMSTCCSQTSIRSDFPPQALQSQSQIFALEDEDDETLENK